MNPQGGKRLCKASAWEQRPVLPGERLRLLGLGEYQPIVRRAKLWLLYSLALFSLLILPRDRGYGASLPEESGVLERTY